jgi:hypothetical protein
MDASAPQTGLSPTVEPATRLDGSAASIPSAQRDAMDRLLAPMMDAARNMTGPEIARAMQGFYATKEDNCPWYAFALRWAMPPLLAFIGSEKEGYQEAFIASGIAAGTDETAQPVRPGGQEPGPQGDAPNLPGASS